MENSYMKLASILKNRRLEKGISTRQMSLQIGISHTEISRIENGLRPNINMCLIIKF